MVLTRIVAGLLIPCLLMDPVLAASLREASLLSVRPAGVALSVLDQQAVVQALGAAFRSAAGYDKPSNIKTVREVSDLINPRINRRLFLNAQPRFPPAVSRSPGADDELGAARQALENALHAYVVTLYAYTAAVTANGHSDSVPRAGNGA